MSKIIQDNKRNSIIIITCQALMNEIICHNTLYTNIQYCVLWLHYPNLFYA